MFRLSVCFHSQYLQTHLGLFVFIAEINKVRVSLFHLNSNKDITSLPEPQGPVSTLSEKLFVPVKEHPDVSTLNYLYFFLSLYKIIINHMPKSPYKRLSTQALPGCGEGDRVNTRSDVYQA